MIDIDMTLHRGGFTLDAKFNLSESVVGLFGPSGSGKSTLLSLMSGLVKPNSGHFVIDGERLFDSRLGINIPIHQRRVGLVFQESRLFPHISVRHNLLYGFNLLTQKDQRFGFDQIVELLELTSLLEHKPDQLSGGQKQRVALGRTLLTSPRLLLLDEPLAALDVRLKDQILPFLRRVKEEIQIPMVYVSHSIDEILYLTQYMAIIDQGKILGVGNFHEVMHDQRVLSLAHSLGLENVLHAIITEQHQALGYSIVQYGLQEICIPLSQGAVGRKVSLSVAASNVALSNKKLEHVTIQNQILGTITAIDTISHRALVSVDVGGNTIIAEISAKSIQDIDLKVGNKTYCLIKTQAIRCYDI
ncbi:MAG: molybdenum ABC transporter ATP-binding protein [Methylophilaceae bacterium]